MKEEIEKLLAISRVEMTEEQKQFIVTELESMFTNVAIASKKVGYIMGYECALEVLNTALPTLKKRMAVLNQEQENKTA